MVTLTHISSHPEARHVSNTDPRYTALTGQLFINNNWKFRNITVPIYMVMISQTGSRAWAPKGRVKTHSTHNIKEEQWSEKNKNKQKKTNREEYREINSG